MLLMNLLLMDEIVRGECSTNYIVALMLSKALILAAPELRNVYPYWVTNHVHARMFYDIVCQTLAPPLHITHTTLSSSYLQHICWIKNVLLWSTVIHDSTLEYLQSGKFQRPF